MFTTTVRLLRVRINIVVATQEIRTQVDFFVEIAKFDLELYYPGSTNFHNQGCSLIEQKEIEIEKDLVRKQTTREVSMNEGEKSELIGTSRGT